jgi:hypothetical protein
MDGTEGRTYGVVVKFPIKMKPLCIGADESETLPGLGTDTSTEEREQGKEQGENTGAANAAPDVVASIPVAALSIVSLDTVEAFGK